MSKIELHTVWATKEADEVCFIYDLAKTTLRYTHNGHNYTMDKIQFLEMFEPKPSNTVEQGIKDDSAKPRYSLLPVGTVNQVVQVLEYGCIKYSIDNWQTVPNARTRYYDATMRHIDAWWQGEVNDSETGFNHLAHAVCCLLFLMWFDSETNDD